LDVDIHIEEAFFEIEILDDASGLSQQVFGGDVAAREVNLVADVVGLAFFDALERELKMD
jgi:hypothetical protein